MSLINEDLLQNVSECPNQTRFVWHLGTLLAGMVQPIEIHDNNKTILYPKFQMVKVKRGWPV